MCSRCEKAPDQHMAAVLHTGGAFVALRALMQGSQTRAVAKLLRLAGVGFCVFLSAQAIQACAP